MVVFVLGFPHVGWDGSTLAGAVFGTMGDGVQFISITDSIKREKTSKNYVLQFVLQSLTCSLDPNRIGSLMNKLKQSLEVRRAPWNQ